MTTDFMEPEPAEHLVRALHARDPIELEAVRLRYLDWFERTDTDLVTREPWPGYFASALYWNACQIRRDDPAEFARLVGWCIANEDDPRVAFAARVFRGTGEDDNYENWTEPYELDLSRLLQTADRDGLIEAFELYQQWAEREFAPHPDHLLWTMHRHLEAIECVSDEDYERLARLGRPGDDDRLEMLTFAIRNFDMQRRSELG